MAVEPAFHNIIHFASTLTVDFFTQNGFNGSDNESFGLDQFDVVLNGVPEPSACALLPLLFALRFLVRQAASAR